MCQTDECCRGYSGHHAPGRAGHHRGCCTPDYLLRHFPTREETISQLEEYLKDLRAEAKGVEERVAGLRRGKP